MSSHAPTKPAAEESVEAERRYIGHYHAVDIHSVDGEPLVRRRRRRESPNLDPRGIVSEEPLLRLLRANGLPVPIIHSFDGTNDHELKYIHGNDLYAYTPTGATLPDGVIEQLAVTWAAQLAVPTDRLQPFAIDVNPRSRSMPTDSQEFHASLVEWLSVLHYQHHKSVNPLLRCVGIGGDRDGNPLGDGQAIWEPFRDESRFLHKRPLRIIHGDLTPKNLIFDGQRLSIIDWEMAAIGDPAWDLAVLIRRSNLTTSDQKLLFAYIERERPDLIGLEDDVDRYRALEIMLSIVNDALRYQRLVAEDPGRIHSATEDLASRMDAIRRRWTDATTDRRMVRKFLLARAVELHAEALQRDQALSFLRTEKVTVMRRDTCTLDVGRTPMTEEEARELLLSHG